MSPHFQDSGSGLNVNPEDMLIVLDRLHMGNMRRAGKKPRPALCLHADSGIRLSSA